MPSRKKPAALAAKVDPTSDEILIAYTGDGTALSDTPARHLSHADVARLAYRRSAAALASEGIRPDPLEPDPEALAAVLEDVLASGHFSTDLSTVEADDEPAAEPTTDDSNPPPEEPADDQPEA